MHPWEETRRLFIPTQGLPLWNYIFPMTLILFLCAWTQRCHVYFMFCHDFPSWKPQQSGEWARSNHRCLGFGPARFQWSPRTDGPITCTEATESRKVLINLSLHHTRLLKWPLLISRLSGTDSTSFLHSWQLSWDSANLEAPVQWPWQSFDDQFAQAS